MFSLLNSLKHITNNLNLLPQVFETSVNFFPCKLKIKNFNESENN